MASQIERITQLLHNTFEIQPWYGSSVMEILNLVSPNIVNQRMGPTHSINELVLHMVSWRLFATKRLNGDTSFQVTDDINFPSPNTWSESLSKLHQSQQQLVEAVKNFPEARLDEICTSKEHQYTYYTLLHGIIQHDVYHLGQIALMRKAFGN